MDYLLTDFQPEKIKEKYVSVNYQDYTISYKQDSVQVKEFEDYLVIFQGTIYDYEEENEIDEISALWDSNKKLTDELKGFYSIIIVEENQFNLFRDRYGAKPVYFTEKDGSILLSSDIKPILKLRPEHRRVNKSIAEEYIKTGRVDHKRDTFFKGIKRMKPKEKIVYKDKCQLEKASYSTEEIKNIRKSLKKSICQMMPSESYYCPISGGLDSTIVGSHCQEADFVHINFTNGTEDKNYIGKVENEFDIVSDRYDVKPIDLLHNVDECIENQEQPTAFPAVQGQSILYSKLKEDSVVLTGTGADELFYGYPWFIPFLLAEKIKEKKFTSFLKTVFNQRKRLSLRHLRKTASLLYRGEAEMLNLCSEDIIDSETETRKVSNIEEAWRNHLENFYFPHMLRITEKQSKMYNLDLRHPFLLSDIDESSIRSWYEENFQKGLNKYILRSAFSEDIPDQVYNRKKKTGFVWMRNDLYTSEVKNRFLETFSSQSFQNRKFIEGEKVVEKFRKNKMYFGTAYRLYCFEKWMRKFID